MSKEGLKGIATGRSDVYRLDPRLLHVKPGWNCRDLDTEQAKAELAELAASIAQVGVKQALTVQWEDGKTFITDGHRRYYATMRAIENGAEIKTVPVQTEDRYSSEADRVFSQIVRNSGKPLLPIEQARVFKRLIDLGWTEKDIAEKSGLGRQWVTDLLGLQAAPEAVTGLVKTGQVAASLAMKAMRQNKGDAGKAAADLTQAVETAKAEGKERATAKHMGEKRPSLKDSLKTLFAAAEIRDALIASAVMAVRTSSRQSKRKIPDPEASARAEAKRARKAAKLRDLAGRGKI